MGLEERVERHAMKNIRGFVKRSRCMSAPKLFSFLSQIISNATENITVQRYCKNVIVYHQMFSKLPIIR